MLETFYQHLTQQGVQVIPSWEEVLALPQPFSYDTALTFPVPLPPPVDPVEASTGVVQALGAAAETGSLLLDGANLAGLIPLGLLILLSSQDLFPTLKELLAQISRFPTQSLVLVHGPSRTADIEKQVVLGAHGPGEVYLFLI